jgi:hypothetical protein
MAYGPYGSPPFPAFYGDPSQAQHNYEIKLTYKSNASQSLITQLEKSRKSKSNPATAIAWFKEFVNHYETGGDKALQGQYLDTAVLVEDGKPYMTHKFTTVYLPKEAPKPPPYYSKADTTPPPPPTPKNWRYKIVTSSDAGTTRQEVYSSGAKFENRDLALADAYSRTPSYSNVFFITVSKDGSSWEQVMVADVSKWNYLISIYDPGAQKTLFKSSLIYATLQDALAALNIIRSNYDDGSKPLRWSVIDRNDTEVRTDIWSPGVIHEVPPPPLPPPPGPLPPPPLPPEPIPEKPSECFIATAAYGTPMAKEINVLRGFRDQRLLPDPLGRRMVQIYYTLSPKAAQIVSKSNPLRAMTRGLLKPIINAIEN